MGAFKYFSVLLKKFYLITLVLIIGIFKDAICLDSYVTPDTIFE